MLKILENFLRQFGFKNIDEATDGTKALEKMKEKKYDLVLSDWNMEPMTGYELLQQVRASDKLKATPFIMVTAESKTENVIAAKKAGVNNYIVKPFNAETLKGKLVNALDNERWVQQDIGLLVLHIDWTANDCQVGIGVEAVGTDFDTEVGGERLTHLPP
jgi:two-component system chemotaxis response regulator CheY